MREAKQLFVKLVCLLAIVAIAWGATACGLTEEKLTTLGESIVALFTEDQDTPLEPSPQPDSPSTPSADNRLYGMYTATVGYNPFSPNPASSIERTITFQDDIMIIQDAYFGQTICEYFIPSNLDSAQIIRYTNVATGEEFTERFKYVAEFDCFTIGEGYSAVTYYK